MKNKLIDLIKPIIITGLFGLVIYSPNLKILNHNPKNSNPAANLCITNELYTNNSLIGSREIGPLRREEDLYDIMEKYVLIDE